MKPKTSRAGRAQNHLDYHDLYSGLIRLHILHHACQEGVFGLKMIEELGHHGYKLSPGTMYPVLHNLEKKGLLSSHRKRKGKSYRVVYKATPAGKVALAAAKQKVRELFGELFERAQHLPHHAGPARTAAK